MVGKLVGVGLVWPPVGVHGIVLICGISSNRKIYLRFGVG